MRPAQRVIIDTDPGIDDAFALAVAMCAPEIDIVGLTSTFGNGSTGVTTSNALRVVEHMGHLTPVVAGVAGPLVRTSDDYGRVVHGTDGLGEAAVPPHTTETQAGTAAQFIVEQLAASPGEITIVSLGPLTNLALALALDPSIAETAKAVVVMGGAIFTVGNASPVAEANILRDPEAAAVVLAASWHVSMVGLDVTERTVMSPAYIEALARLPNASGRLLGKILPFYQRFHNEMYGLSGGVFTHDPSAISFVIDPTLFVGERLPLHVELVGRCAGQTTADRRRQWTDLPEVDVCIGVDSDGVLDLLLDRLKLA